MTDIHTIMYFSPLTSPKSGFFLQRMVSIAGPITCQTLQVLFLNMYQCMSQP